uniref:C2H2-type domain-containing protein n=1 Tax=Timema monikensis TaxID=170555 RepID=A0A7R9HW09_9NEOP|nr:unnamed protein product [Timema monikensis]
MWEIQADLVLRAIGIGCVSEYTWYTQTEPDCYTTQINLETTNGAIFHSIIKQEIISHASSSGVREDIGFKEELCFNESLNIDDNENKTLELSHITGENNKNLGFQVKNNQLMKSTFLDINPNLSQKDWKKYNCDDSNKSFTKKSITNREQRPHKCNVCGKSFNRKCGLSDHLLTHSDQRPLKCDVCVSTERAVLVIISLLTVSKNLSNVMFVREVFILRVNLIVISLFIVNFHVTYVKFVAKVLISIRILKTIYLLIRYFKNHLLAHSSLRTYNCNDCGKCFKRKDSLKDHLLTHSDNH